MRRPLFLLPFTGALLLAGCGGSNTGGDNAPRIAPPSNIVPTPTVSLSAPASAVIGYAFTVSWVSTDATSCTSSFGGGSGASGTASVTETTTGDKTFTVSCTGAGGTTNASANTSVAGLPTAEGLWQGTTGDGRTISGVVTKEGDYWFAYTQSGNAAIVGFYVGRGISTATTASAGTFASANLREINFAGGFSGGGDAAAGAISSTVFSNKASFSGSLDTVAGGAISSASFSVTSIGNLNVPGTPPAPPIAAGTNHSTSPGSATLDGNSGALTVDINVTNDISVNGTAPSRIRVDTHTVFTGTLAGSSFAWTAGTSTASNCVRLSGANICGFIPTAPQSATYDQNPIAFDLSTVGAQTVITNKAADPTNLTTYTFTATGITLSSLPSITADTFNFATYNEAYDATPALTTITGSYTGSAGVGVATQTSATFNIAADGAITGSEPSGCSYSGTAATHSSGGNVYDVTALTFSGGACAYSASGPFTGVATYDATTHTATVMAVNGSRDQGFLFVGNKPQP